MVNEGEESKIEGVDSVIEGVESENKVLDNKVLTPERKGYILSNPPNISYSDKRATRRCMTWNNLTVGSNELHINLKVNINVVNSIASFVKPTPTTNIITNETILMQYSNKYILNVFGKKGEAEVWKELQQFRDIRVVEPKKTQDLSYEEQRRSLSYLIFLKLKINEFSIKGIGYADVRKNQDWLSK